MNQSNPVSALSLPDATDLELLSDPARGIDLACERAKRWLVEALEGGDIERIIEIKSQAEVIRIYTIHKKLGRDSELMAAEIVRRAERCIGLAIRKGQAEGTIKVRGDHRHTKNLISPSDCDRSLRTLYAMIDDVTHEQFDAAIESAKSQNNLSRSNVVKTLKGNGSNDLWNNLPRLIAEGNSSSQIAKALGFSRDSVYRRAKAIGIEIPADRVMGKTRNIDQNRVLSEFAGTLESLVPSCEMIDPSALDGVVLTDCISIMDDALKALRKMLKRLKGEVDGR